MLVLHTVEPSLKPKSATPIGFVALNQQACTIFLIDENVDN